MGAAWVREALGCPAAHRAALVPGRSRHCVVPRIVGPVVAHSAGGVGGRTGGTSRPSTSRGERRRPTARRPSAGTSVRRCHLPGCRRGCTGRRLPNPVNRGSTVVVIGATPVQPDRPRSRAPEGPELSRFVGLSDCPRPGLVPLRRHPLPAAPTPPRRPPPTNDSQIALHGFCGLVYPAAGVDRVAGPPGSSPPGTSRWRLPGRLASAPSRRRA